MVTGSEPGDYTLRLDTLIKSLILDASERIARGRRLRVTGSLVDAEGLGVSSASVLVSSALFEPTAGVTDAEGRFRVPQQGSFVSSDPCTLGLCAYAAGGEALAMTFVQMGRGDEADEASREEVYLTLADVSDLLTFYGDTALADAAYAQRVQAGVIPDPDHERLARGTQVLDILKARLSAAAIRQGLRVTANDPVALVIYDGPANLLEPGAPVVAAMFGGD